MAMPATNLDAGPDPREPMTVEEYLVYDAASPVRNEYVYGRVYAMTGASRRHNDIHVNLVEQLLPPTRASGCRLYYHDMRLRVSPEVFYYPDFVVVCDPADTDPYNVIEPCVVVEILSPSTARTDRNEKVMAYRSIDTLQAYLIVSRDEQRVERHSRDEQGAWQRQDIVGDNDVLLPCVNASLKLADLYRGVAPIPSDPTLR